MATDGPTPPDCVADIYERGTLMFQTASIGGSNAIERWVKKLAATSGQPVDWHFAGGRVMVLALGDLVRVRAAIREHMPEHDEMFRANIAGLLGDEYASSRQPYRPAWWDNDETPERDTVPRVERDAEGRLVMRDPMAAEIIAAVQAANSSR